MFNEAKDLLRYIMQYDPAPPPTPGMKTLKYNPSYMMGVLHGQQPPPQGFTVHGETEFVRELFLHVVQMLEDNSGRVHYGVFNFLHILNFVHPLNVNMAHHMRMYVFNHPNFVRHYMPLYQQSHPDHYSEFKRKMTGPYLNELLNKNVPIPDMDDDHFIMFARAVGERTVEVLLHNPEFIQTILNFIQNSNGPKEKHIVKSIMQQIMSPDFMQHMLQNPELMHRIRSFFDHL